MTFSSRIPLEQYDREVVYGTKGPDKWVFIMEGVLDPRHDGTYHEFTIGGKKVGVTIESAKRIPSWQCPPYPDETAGLHELAWAEAWEFIGFGSGSHVYGIYSPRSRKGVFHFWPIKTASHGCHDCQEDLRMFFKVSTNSEAMLCLMRAMSHMTRGSALGGFHIDCTECWKLFSLLRHRCDTR